MATVSSIRPLPADVLSQIRSSVIIASLNDVVLNLLKNSLDGNASSIDVTIDYGRGSCSVEDDGLGIEPVEFSKEGGLGKMHHTSKYSQSAKTHGGRGSFLALLSALSLVSITSHHQKHRSHNSISLHRSNVIARQIPAPAQQRILNKDHGTRVAVRDLFGGMPVRVRQRTSDPAANDRDWQMLRKMMIGLLLAWPHEVSLTVRNVISNQNMKIRASPYRKDDREPIVTRICNLLSNATFITPSDREFWVSTRGAVPNLVISGAISTEPCPHKNVQFLSFHIFAMANCNGGNLLYDHINRIFAKSSFGCEEEDEPLNGLEMRKKSTDARYKQDGYTSKQLKGSKKSGNKWPMFCLKIESQELSSSLGEEMADRFLDERKGHLASVMELLEKMIVGFLKAHHFRVQTRNRNERRVRTPDHQSTESSRTIPPKKDVATSASRRASSSKKQPLLDLAMGIKIPSFSKQISSDTESPFNTWTRVKRGQGRQAPKEANESSIPNTDVDSLGQDSLSVAKPRLSLPPRSTSIASQNITDVARVSTLGNGPLIGSNGRVSRPPFNLEIHGPEEQGTAIKQSNMESEVSADDTIEPSEDDLVAWTNPISREESLICRRTGMVVPAQNSTFKQDLNLSRSISRSGSLTSQTRQSLRTRSRTREEPSTWISGLLNSWDNPVFQPAELPIPQVSTDGLDIESHRILHGHHHNCSHVDIDKAFRQSSGGLSGRVSKDALRNAQVISQVDKKFILIKINTRERDNAPDADGADLNLLVLVDQHAADERCRLEDLLSELCVKNMPLPLEIPLTFAISEQELQLFRRDTDHFTNWGISYEVHDRSAKNRQDMYVSVKGLPSVIIERCKIEPQVLTRLMRAEIWRINQDTSYMQLRVEAHKTPDTVEPGSKWFTKLRDCPEGILDMLNSRSCRSAIMFNDELSAQQCKSLITRLSQCAFPFQCAHGRPSMVPLVDLSTVFPSPTPSFGF